MAANADKTFWAFVWYVRNNRFKTVESMTDDDFVAMAAGYARENSTEITYPDAGTYTEIEYPGAISAAKTRLACDQADYPEGHFKKAKYGA